MEIAVTKSNTDAPDDNNPQMAKQAYTYPCKPYKNKGKTGLIK
jgi:hypothetical protein